jgi:hypothetical protein
MGIESCCWQAGCAAVECELKLKLPAMLENGVALDCFDTDLCK